MSVISLVEDTAVLRKQHQPPRIINGINNPEYQRNRRSKRQRWIQAYKVAKGCELCGYNAHAVALDFDHIDPTQKSFLISSRSMTLNLKRLINEMRKCRILCANCHRVHTSTQNQHTYQREGKPTGRPPMNLPREDIREEYKTGLTSIRKLAKKHNVAKATIQKILEVKND